MFGPIHGRLCFHRQLVMLLAVPACLLFGGIAQAQVCPNTGNPLPNGGGTPQAGGNPGAAQQRATGGGGQLNAQGAFQLVNFAQQAVRIQQLIQYQQADQIGRRQPTRLAQPQASVANRRGVRSAKSRPTTPRSKNSRRAKLVARLKQREQERARKADELRARRAKGT